MNPKEAAYDFCDAFVEERLDRIQKSITSIQESLTSETKSSAGDKHETGRAMLQLEREKLGQQLAEAEATKQLLAKVNIIAQFDKIGFGSLVKTSKTNYFLAISAGEFKNGENAIFCISVGTPIGQLLLGKSIGEQIIFNGESIQILAIN